MANIPIYPGSSSFFPGKTPFGFYDNDYQFQQDADKVAKFCAYRLGYPIENVELQDLNFYTAFEQAVTVYGNELYAYKVRDNILSLEGAPTSSTLNNSLISPNMGNIIRLSEQYGSEAGVGGNTTWYSGSITLTSSIQDYDLSTWASNNGISGSDLEVKRVYFNGKPASADYYYGAPGFGLGVGFGGFLGAYGFTAYNTAYSSLVMPVSYDMGAIQELEISNTVRMSGFSFELINNKLRIFPIPGTGDDGTNLWFQYLKKSERLSNSISSQPGNITNVSNVPYGNPVYTQINSVGRSWIFEYTLAVCKEMLGYVRGKYSSIPIPGADLTLNQSDLISAATAEKQALIERLRAYLEETSREKLLERRSLETDSRIKELQQVPYVIYIG